MADPFFCPICNNSLEKTDLSMVNYVCHTCASGLVLTSKERLNVKYTNIRSLKFRIDYVNIEMGVVYLVDILVTFLITTRFIYSSSLQYNALLGWLLQIIGARALLYLITERAPTGVLYGMLQSTLDAFTGFIFLNYIQGFYMLTIFLEIHMLIFALLVSAISSWLSIILLISRIRDFRKTNYRRKNLFLKLQKTK